MAFKFFSPEVLVFDDELDKLRQLIILYSCHQKLNGKSSVIIRDKLVTLLALYLKNGYSRETKNFAANVLGVKTEAISSMNLEIRNLGLMYQDKYNSRINHLCEDLIVMKGYLKDESPERAHFLFLMKRGK